MTDETERREPQIPAEKVRQLADVAWVNSISRADLPPQLGNGAEVPIASGSLFSVCGKPGEVGTVVLRVDYDIPKSDKWEERHVDLSLVGVYGASGKVEPASDTLTTRRNVIGGLDLYSPFTFAIKDEDGSPDRLPFHIPTSINTSTGAIGRKSDHYRTAYLFTASEGELNLRTSDINIGYGYFNKQVAFHPAVLRNGPGEGVESGSASQEPISANVSKAAEVIVQAEDDPSVEANDSQEPAYVGELREELRRLGPQAYAGATRLELDRSIEAENGTKSLVVLGKDGEEGQTAVLVDVHEDGMLDYDIVGVWQEGYWQKPPNEYYEAKRKVVSFLDIMFVGTTRDYRYNDGIYMNLAMPGKEGLRFNNEFILAIGRFLNYEPIGRAVESPVEIRVIKLGEDGKLSTKDGDRPAETGEDVPHLTHGGGRIEVGDPIFVPVAPESGFPSRSPDDDFIVPARRPVSGPEPASEARPARARGQVSDALPGNIRVEVTKKPDTSRMNVGQLVDYAAKELKATGTTTLEFTPDQIGQLMKQVVRDLLSKKNTPVTEVGDPNVDIDSGNISVKGSAVAVKGATIDVSFSYLLRSNTDGSLGSGSLEISGLGRGIVGKMAQGTINTEIGKIQSTANSALSDPSRVLTGEVGKQLKSKGVELDRADMRIGDDRLVVTLHSKQKPQQVSRETSAKPVETTPPVIPVAEAAPVASPPAEAASRPAAEVAPKTVEVPEPSPRDSWETARSALVEVVQEAMESGNAGRKVGKIVGAIGPLINSYMVEGLEPSDDDRIAFGRAIQFTSSRIAEFEDSLTADFEPERTDITWDGAYSQLQIAITARLSGGSLGDIIGALGPVLEAYPGLSKSERDEHQKYLKTTIALLKHNLGKLAQAA